MAKKFGTTGWGEQWLAAITDSELRDLFTLDDP